MEMETENRKMASENVSRNFDSLLCFARGRVVCVSVYVWVCVYAIRISLYVFPHLYLCVCSACYSLCALSHSMQLLGWFITPCSSLSLLFSASVCFAFVNPSLETETKPKMLLACSF